MIPVILLFLFHFCSCQPDVTYVVNMDSQIECCDEESRSFLDVSEVAVTRYNETFTYMSGTANFLQDVGDNTMIEIMIQKEASGKYALVFLHEIQDLCDEVRKGENSVYYSYIKPFQTCPFEAGEFQIKDFVIKTSDVPVNSKTAGRYQVMITFYKKPEPGSSDSKEFMFCVFVKLIVEME